MDIRDGYYKCSEEVVFIIENPFNVRGKKMIIKKGNESDSIVLKAFGAADAQQQFMLNNIPLHFNKDAPLTQNINYIEFSGHAKERFSNIYFDFYSHNSRSYISCEVLFLAGLPPFIAYVIFITTLFIVIISLFYIWAFDLGNLPTVQTSARQR